MTGDLVPDQFMRLPDGRRLGFCIYGDPRGLPVVFLHGTPGSRLQIVFAHEVCRGLGWVSPSSLPTGGATDTAKPRARLSWALMPMTWQR